MPRPEGENAALVAVEALPVADWSEAVVPLAVMCGVVAVMLLLSRIRPSLPGSLIAIVAATVVIEVADLPVARIGLLPAGLPTPSLPAWDSGALRAMYPSALAIAALAALESPLSACVADGMVEGVPDTHANRELVGQGLANGASGIFGGMPATGALARADGTVFLITGAVTIVFDLVVAVQAGMAVAAFLALRAMAQDSGLDRVGVPDELDAEEEDGLLHEPSPSTGSTVRRSSAGRSSSSTRSLG